MINLPNGRVLIRKFLRCCNEIFKRRAHEHTKMNAKNMVKKVPYRYNLIAPLSFFGQLSPQVVKHRWGSKMSSFDISKHKNCLSLPSKSIFELYLRLFNLSWPLPNPSVFFISSNASSPPRNAIGKSAVKIARRPPTMGTKLGASTAVFIIFNFFVLE